VVLGRDPRKHHLVFVYLLDLPHAAMRVHAGPD
jgi:hypothetical protein